MNDRRHIGFLVMLIVAGWTSGQAAEGPEQVFWHEGERRHEAWVDPFLLAEFAPNPSQEAVVRRAARNAEIEARVGERLRLWRLLGTAPQRAAALAQILAGPGAFSPVLRGHPSGQGGRRALAGGVIVVLDPSWDGAAVARWAVTQAVEIERSLAPLANTFVLRSPPGLASLQLANRVHASGTARAAMPNLWREVVTK